MLPCILIAPSSLAGSGSDIGYLSYPCLGDRHLPENLKPVDRQLTKWGSFHFVPPTRFFR